MAKAVISGPVAFRAGFVHAVPTMTRKAQVAGLGLAPLLRRAATALCDVDPTLAAELAQAALDESTPIKGLSVARFLAVVAPLLPLLSVPPPKLRTKAWYGKVGKMLRQSGLDEETSAELARKVATWATQPISVETLVTKAAQFLSTPEPGKVQAGGLGPRKMFEEDSGD